MISEQIVNKIEVLFQAGKSQRAISRETGVSRDTIRRIVSGEREQVAPLRKKAPPYVRSARRCPDCGAMVFMPCRACAIRYPSKTA